MPAAIEQRSRRIVVVFGGEANTGVVSVLDSLVSRSRAHVTGVFIEDHTLFRTAELPFTMEVCRITTVRRPLRTAELERQMRLLAQRAERVLRRVAERAGLPWSFRRHRGRLGTALADVSWSALLGGPWLQPGSSTLPPEQFARPRPNREDRSSCSTSDPVPEIERSTPVSSLRSGPIGA